MVDPNSLSGALSSNDPYPVFDAWLAQARAHEPRDPEAMTLATVGRDGRPDARIVLLKAIDDEAFVFYTHSISKKGDDLACVTYASLVFYWKSLEKQIRVRGRVTQCPPEKAEVYFATRSRGSQCSAALSRQSAPLDEPEAFQREVERCAASTGPVMRPATWLGYAVHPESFEFWQAHPWRAHTRVRFVRVSDAKGHLWQRTILYP